MPAVRLFTYCITASTAAMRSDVISNKFAINETAAAKRMLDIMMTENKLLVFNSEEVFTALTGGYWFVCQYFIRLLIH